MLCKDRHFLVAFNWSTGTNWNWRKQSPKLQDFNSWKRIVNPLVSRPLVSQDEDLHKEANDRIENLERHHSNISKDDWAMALRSLETGWSLRNACNVDCPNIGLRENLQQTLIFRGQNTLNTMLPVDFPINQSSDSLDTHRRLPRDWMPWICGSLGFKALENPCWDLLGVNQWQSRFGSTVSPHVFSIWGCFKIGGIPQKSQFFDGQS